MEKRQIHFTKMQGAGNDYIYINGASEHIDDADKPAIIRRLSDRHFGIGSDGVIFINPSAQADFEMEMYNADGSRGEMCGNGIRCVARYVYDHHMTDKTSGLTIESFGRNRNIDLIIEGGEVSAVRVDMGAPILTPAEIPLDTAVFSGEEPVIGRQIQIADRDFAFTAVSMGNPHAVVFLDPGEETGDFALEKYGPVFEEHFYFPKKVNTEFVQVDDRSNVHMRVWERGSGETLACGTGCCATAVACILNGLTDEEITVHVLGGDVICRWDRAANKVFMTGPAETVFEGVVEISSEKFNNIS